MLPAPIGILYEHPEWFLPLFAELDRRELPYLPIHAARLNYDPAERSAPYTLVFNRMSPSAYLRGHTRAIFAAQHYLAHLEGLGVPLVNGTAAYGLELSKARQAIVRVEALDGAFLYAIRIHNDPSQGFNLCPADICQVPDASASPPQSGFDLCPVDAPASSARQIEAVDPPTWIKDAVLRICATAGLDLGGVEYLESDRDGQVYFYDINALSNFVTDAPNLVGFDPFVRLVDVLAQRWSQAAQLRSAVV
jgi:hypothetical protein